LYKITVLKKTCTNKTRFAIALNVYIFLNRQYGNFHNNGHNLIAYAHDPTNKHLEKSGVMGDTTTTMRDPVFYKWHSFVDNLFQEHKRHLPPYSAEDLCFPGICVQGINVESRDQTNMLTTFWQQSDLDMSRGLDFSPRGKVSARFTHLQHSEFTYNIEVENTSGATREGFVRIFLAPMLDERNGIMKSACKICWKWLSTIYSAM